MRLVGARSNPIMGGVGELPAKAHYFLGSDPRAWRTNLPTYAKVRYADIYPGIDMIFYGNAKQLEYDFIVAPGNDPACIRLAFEGPEQIELDPHGDLVLSTATGKIEQHKPGVYQEVGGIRQEISGEYVLSEERQVSFQIGSYDHNVPLIIDPALVYSSYLGGSGGENGRFMAGIAVDSEGQAYVTGSTDSLNFPTTHALQFAPGGNSDAYIAKVNASGSGLLYSTYFGGSGLERSSDIAVDSSGNVYITGRTQSPNLPILNPIQAILRGNEDAFVAKLSPDGSRLLYSTYLGGSRVDYGMGIAVDSAGSAYVTGSTSSTDLPTANAFQPSFGGAIDAFVAKLDPSGSRLVYLTYLGGNSYEAPGDFEGRIAVDGNGNACIVGVTASGNFPTRNPLQAALSGPVDAFITKINASGTDLIGSTYFGGSKTDYAVSVALDGEGSVHLIGLTESLDLPVKNAVQSEFGGGSVDAFIAKLDPTCGKLVYCSYIGGEAEDIGHDIAVDLSGAAYVTGTTTSLNFPIKNPMQDGMRGNRDAFILKINPPGDDLAYSTFWGGSGIDYGLGIALDGAANAYILGRTDSSDLPMQQGFQTAPGSMGDAFIAKIADTNLAFDHLYYLPQVADGNYGSGSFRTTLVLVNPNAMLTEISVRLTGDDGAPMIVHIPELGSGAQFSLTLNPGATCIFQTDGVGHLQAGAAIVTTKSEIGVSAIFSLYDDAGRFLTESGVGSSIPASTMLIPVETSQVLNTGVSLLNPVAATATVNLVLLDQSGAAQAETQVTMTGKQHLARFVAGPNQLFPAVTDFKGILRIFCETPLAAVALRQNQDPLCYTSIPAHDQRSSAKAINLAQAANGFFGQGYFTTSFLLFNNWVTPAAITLSLMRDDGSNWPVTMSSGQTGSRHSMQIPRDGSISFSTDGSGSLTAGSAIISCDVPLGGAAIFSVYDLQGKFQTEAGVGNSALWPSFTIPADVTGTFDTGVAFFNPSSSSATLALRLIDGDGKVVGRSTLTLPGNNHTATFVSGLFPSTADFRGSLAVDASVAIAALTLRQNSNPLSYTTLPVVKGTVPNQ